jgi:hypothetical protein
MGNVDDRVKIQFHVIDNHRGGDNNQDRRVFSEERFVRPTDSLRAHANEIILGHSGDPGSAGDDWDEEDTRKNTNLLIFSLLPLEIVQRAQTNGEERPPWIDYYFQENGAIVRLEIGRASGHDFLWKDLQPLVAAGYITGDAHNIVVMRPQGLGAAGAGGFDFVAWLNDVGVDLNALPAQVVSGLFGFFLKSLLKNIRRAVFQKRSGDRQARKIISDWDSRSFTGPRELRAWLDIKHSWTIDEVCNRLKVNNEIAMRLFRALGYRGIDGVWSISTGRAAKLRRAKWLKAEPNQWNLGFA